MILNLTKKKVIAYKPYFVYGVIANLRGMIKRRFSDFDAIVFQNSKGLHTLFSDEDIDVLFVDIENNICQIVEDFAHWRIKLKCKNAVCIVCLPKGCVNGSGIEVNDILDLNAELTKSKKKKFKRLNPLIEPSPGTVLPCTNKD